MLLKTTNGINYIATGQPHPHRIPHYICTELWDTHVFQVSSAPLRMASLREAAHQQEASHSLPPAEPQQPQPLSTPLWDLCLWLQSRLYLQDFIHSEVSSVILHVVLYKVAPGYDLFALVKFSHGFYSGVSMLPDILRAHWEYRLEFHETLQYTAIAIPSGCPTSRIHDILASRMPISDLKW